MKKFISVLVVLVLVYAVCALVFFEKETFTVQFETVGGQDLDDVVYEDDALPDVTPTKEGYSFVNWYLDSEYTKLAEKLDNETVLYAKWALISYSITYVSNKPTDAWGSVVGNMTRTVLEYNKTGAVKTNGYSLTGWTFAGWNTKANGSGDSYAEGKSIKNLFSNDEDNLNLYATWVASEYTLKFDSNCPSDAETAITGSMEDIACTYDTDIDLPTVPYTLAHWAFLGWNTMADGSGESYENASSPRNLTAENGGTTTLYATWAKVLYTVTYMSNVPANATSTAEGTMATTSLTYNTADTLTTNAFTLLGWAFNGWNTMADGTGTPYADGTVISTIIETNIPSINLYAMWTANSFKVNYNINAPTGSTTSGTMEASDFTYDAQNILTPCDYTVAGYKFASWNTMADGSGTAYNNNQDIANIVSENGAETTIYAIWQAHTYTVTFDVNAPVGATVNGTMDNLTIHYDLVGFLPPVGYTVDSYTFMGWSLTPNGSITYGDSAPIFAEEEFEGDGVVLYAIWH